MIRKTTRFVVGPLVGVSPMSGYGPSAYVSSEFRSGCALLGYVSPGPRAFVLVFSACVLGFDVWLSDSSPGLRPSCPRRTLLYSLWVCVTRICDRGVLQRAAVNRLEVSIVVAAAVVVRDKKFASVMHHTGRSK